MSLLAVLPSIPLLSPCIDAVTNANGDKPVRQLSRQATIAVKKIAAEQVTGSALAEGRDGIGDYSALLLYSMVVITPPYVVDLRARHFAHGGRCCLHLERVASVAKESRGFGVVEERNGAPETLVGYGEGANSDRTCLSRFRIFRFLFVATQRVRASTD